MRSNRDSCDLFNRYRFEVWNYAHTHRLAINRAPDLGGLEVWNNAHTHRQAINRALETSEDYSRANWKQLHIGALVGRIRDFTNTSENYFFIRGCTAELNRESPVATNPWHWKHQTSIIELEQPRVLQNWWNNEQTYIYIYRQAI